MVRVTLWPQLLLVVLILRQSAAVSDHCSQLQEEISGLQLDNVKITELKHIYELQAGNCDEQLTNELHTSKATARKLNVSEALNSELKKQLELKEEDLKSINEKQTKLHTTIDGLTKTVDSMNHTVQKLFEIQKEEHNNFDGVSNKVLKINIVVLKLIGKQTNLQTNIDDLTKRVELLNEMSQFLCELPTLTPATQLIGNKVLWEPTWHLDMVCRSLLDAAKSGDVDRTKRLVKCDSNDKCTDGDDNRETPMIHAAERGHVEVVRVLLEGGHNVNRDNSDRRTALDYAAGFGHLSLCRLLLDWGAKVNNLNRWLHTPLHNAAANGHLSIVKLLVEKGADVSLKNDNGETASDVAWRLGKRDVAEWLNNLKRG